MYSGRGRLRRLLARRIDRLPWDEVQDGERGSEAEDFDSPRGQERRLGSAPKRRRAVMFAVMSWKTRGGLKQRGIPSPVNKPPKKKNNQTAPPHREGDGTARQEGRADRCQPRVITVTEATERRAAADERRLREKRDERQTLLSASLRGRWFERGISWTRASYSEHRRICCPRATIVGRSRSRRIGDTIVWSPETLYLWKLSREKERRCLEFGWQKRSGRRWNWMSLTGSSPIWSTLQYFLSAGEREGRRRMGEQVRFWSALAS